MSMHTNILLRLLRGSYDRRRHVLPSLPFSQGAFRFPKRIVAWSSSTQSAARNWNCREKYVLMWLFIIDDNKSRANSFLGQLA